METQLVFDNGSISPGTIRWVKFCCLDTLISLMANKSYKVSLKKKGKQVGTGGAAEERPEQQAVLHWKSDLCRKTPSTGLVMQTSRAEPSLFSTSTVGPLMQCSPSSQPVTSENSNSTVKPAL